MKEGAKKLYLLGGILIGGLLVLAYFIVFPPQKDSKSVKNINDDISLPADTNENANLNTNTQPAISPDSPFYPVALARDTVRLQHVRTIVQALEMYKSKNGHYPGSLNDLYPEQLQTIPENPTPGGLNYVYTPIGTEPYNFYSVYYNLEVGVEGISAGEHEATPQGIATL